MAKHKRKKISSNLGSHLELLPVVQKLRAHAKYPDDEVPIEVTPVDARTLLIALKVDYPRCNAQAPDPVFFDGQETLFNCENSDRCLGQHLATIGPCTFTWTDPGLVCSSCNCPLHEAPLKAPACECPCHALPF